MPSTVAVLTVAVLLLVGCGSGSATPKPHSEASKTATQVLKDVEKSLRQASSVHISGAWFSATPRGHIHFDATSVTDKGGTASVTGGDVAFKVVAIDDEVYVRGNKAFSGSAASTLGGRWLKCSTNSVMGERSSWTAPFFVLNPMYHGILRNKGETTYNGEKTVEIDGSRGFKLYVATTGTPYPLAIVVQRQAVTFDDFNARVALTAPKNAIAVSKFCGKL